MVSAANSHLRIARELLPRAGTADPARARWGTRAPAGAHMAVAEPTPMVAVAAPVGNAGGSGACHNCGEVGHYKNGCPYLRRNSSVRGQGGGGGRGGGRAPRACYVCGDLSHVASQCAKRVIPVAAAAAPAATQGDMRSAGAADFQAFEEWKAMAAAVATEVERSEDEYKWDDQDYVLGAVALPLGQMGPAPAVHLAAAGTKAGAEKAKATRAATKGKARDGGAGQVVAPVRQAGGIGTALIAKPGDAAAIGALRNRRDKAAAKERMARLPDHGRQVAFQRLNRLPAGFPIRTVGGQRPRVPAGGAQVQVTRHALSLGMAGQGQPAQRAPPSGPVQQVPVRSSSTVSYGAGPALTGGVQVQVGVFLELALKAGIDLAEVLALTGPGVVGSTRQQKLATLAALENVAPRALVQQAGAMMGLSPIARRAQSAAETTVQQEGTSGDQAAGTEGAGAPSPLPTRRTSLRAAVVAGEARGVRPEHVVAVDRQGARRLGRVSNLTYRGAVAKAVAGVGAPKSSAMGAARMERRDREARDVALARQIAMRGGCHGGAGG
jgi:hypothetical protein